MRPPPRVVAFEACVEGNRQLTRAYGPTWNGATRHTALLTHLPLGFMSIERGREWVESVK